MKAARWYKAKDIRVEDIAEPTVSAGKVKVKVAWTGICGSDLHEYMAGPIFAPVDKPHPLSQDTAPIVMGHEFSGVVEEVGEGVTKVKPGDRVVVEPILACGKCPACLHGKYNLCEHLGFHGLSGGGGGFSSHTVVQERMVHHLPDSLSFEQGALVEPAAVALHAVRLSSLKAGGSAVVFGVGPIGLLLVEALRAAGAATIYVVEPSEQRAAKALELGAHIAINPTKEDAVAKIRELSDGGVDVAFEVTGVPKVLQQCIDSTRYEGETIIVSIWEKEASIQPNAAVLQERTIKGIIAYRDIFPAVMGLMEKGFFSADKLVTKKINLENIVEEGFETLVKDKEQIKILVKPSAE